MRGTDVLAAADAAAGFLEPLAGRDWSRTVPGLDFTVASVVAHAACGPLWYAIDFTGGPGDDGAFEIGVRRRQHIGSSHDAHSSMMIVTGPSLTRQTLM